MFEPFAHYLSYGATDQATLRDLRGLYQGLLVPGTVAAFQHEGTGGFVLTLSATVEGAPYAIDPRFPLFQQSLPSPKRSHEALASVLGAPELIRQRDPSPDDFEPGLVQSIAEAWVRFNELYQGSAGGKFGKYAERLDEPVLPEDAVPPEAILTPYLMADDTTDDWWGVSKALHDATSQLDPSLPVIRVVASTSAAGLRGLLQDLRDEDVAIWVSGLDEREAAPEELASYLGAIADSRERGIRAFALYGGFFAVVAGRVGLSGACHGIGFGEHRDWPELPRSGPAPPRFYLPKIHRYVSQEDAQRLHNAAPRLARCECEHCGGREPIELEYHDLMKHSVACRAVEIEELSLVDLQIAADWLESELAEFLDGLAAADTTDLLWSRMSRASEHLNRWVSAIRIYSTR